MCSGQRVKKLAMDNDDIKKYRVEITSVIYDRMWHHISFLAEVSESAAEDLEEKLYAAMTSLEVFPYRNPKYESLLFPSEHYRSMLVGKHHRITYLIEENVVYVDDIIDCREEM